jgi:hypothetical protein
MLLKDSRKPSQTTKRLAVEYPFFLATKPPPPPLPRQFCHSEVPSWSFFDFVFAFYPHWPIIVAYKCSSFAKVV